jgi:hypothetical protein
MISNVTATAILLLVLGTLSVIAAIPQLYTLVHVKKSDQFNIFSWFVWLGYETTSCAYSYAIHAYIYLAINALWALFYAAMVILILKYRR